jgi:hypothetical protein
MEICLEKIITITSKRIIKNTLIALAILCLEQNLHAQEPDLMPFVYPAGIYAGFSYGSYSVKDQYISREKYSGTMPMFSVGWARCHDKYIYHLSFEYGKSGDISNNNVQTDITQFKLEQGFLYPLNNHSRNPEKISLFLGPTTEVFYYGNDPKIAVSGFDYTNSIAVMLSLGVSFDAIYPLSNKFQLESSLGITALSLGWRSVDSEEDNRSQTKLLTLVSGLNMPFDLGVRYKFYRRFSTSAGYKFQLTSITPWEPLISASNSFFIGFTYNL